MVHLSRDHWFGHVRPTLKLAVPVMFSRAGLLIMIAVDTAMCGHAGGDALAAYGIGSAPQVPLLLIGIGLLMGTVVLTAQAEGAGQHERTGAIWKTAIIHAACYGVVIGLLSLPGEWLFRVLGQTDALAESGGRVLAQFGWGLPGALLFSACVFYLEGLHRPVPGMVVMMLANVVNAAANYVLIYGAYGWPEMGAAGAAFATSLTRWFMFFAVLAYIAVALDKHYYGLTGTLWRLKSNGKQFRRIGYPMALGQGMESSSFSAVAIIAGWMGTAVVGAWAIAINVLSIVFMFSLGFTTAASVRVGNAMGKQDAANLARAGWVGVALCAMVLFGLGAILYGSREFVAAIYTDTGDVLLAAVATLVVTAVVLIPDGLQSVAVGALRGASDFWPPAITQLVAFWLVMVPIAYWYGYRADGGAVALMQSVGIGAAVAALILFVRFHWLTVRFRRNASTTLTHAIKPS